jgi:PAS domain S-box-containing protein
VSSSSHLSSLMSVIFSCYFSGKESLASVQRTSAASSVDVAAQFSILDNILDVAIVIDERGTIQFFNRQAISMFGFSSGDVIGRNVKMLMPTSHADQHDSYLRNYMTTGKAKVIGVGRDVIAQCKDGSIVPVNLSLTEHKLSDGKRFFTGILRKFEEEKGKMILLFLLPLSCSFCELLPFLLALSFSFLVSLFLFSYPFFPIPHLFLFFNNSERKVGASTRKRSFGQLSGSCYGDR